MGTPSDQTAFGFKVYTTVWGSVLVSSACVTRSRLPAESPLSSTEKALGSTASSTSSLDQLGSPLAFGLHAEGAWSMPTVTVPPRTGTRVWAVVVPPATAPHDAASSASAAGRHADQRGHRGRSPRRVTAGGGPA